MVHEEIVLATRVGFGSYHDDDTMMIHLEAMMMMIPAKTLETLDAKNIRIIIISLMR